jgi:hypothetical protein
MKLRATIQHGLTCCLLALSLLPWSAKPASDPKAAANGRPPAELAADPRALMKWRFQQVLEDKANVSGIFLVRGALQEMQDRYQKLADDYLATGNPEPAKQAALAINMVKWYAQQGAIMDQIMQYKTLQERLYQNANVTPAQAQEMVNQAKTEIPRLLADLKKLAERPPNAQR